jgi:hypothetical protein
MPHADREAALPLDAACLGRALYVADRMCCKLVSSRRRFCYFGGLHGLVSAMVTLPPYSDDLPKVGEYRHAGRVTVGGPTPHDSVQCG